MASIINRGPYQFQALIRRKGYPTQTRTFETQREAKDWARDVEAKMRRGEFDDLSEAEATTLGCWRVGSRFPVTRKGEIWKIGLQLITIVADGRNNSAIG